MQRKQQRQTFTRRTGLNGPLEVEIIMSNHISLKKFCPGLSSKKRWCLQKASKKITPFWKRTFLKTIWRGFAMVLLSLSSKLMQPSLIKKSHHCLLKTTWKQNFLNKDYIFFRWEFQWDLYPLVKNIKIPLLGCAQEACGTALLWTGPLAELGQGHMWSCSSYLFTAKKLLGTESYTTEHLHSEQ